MTGDVRIAMLTPFIEDKKELPSRRFHRGPVTCQDGLLESWIRAADIVGREQIIVTQIIADLFVEAIEYFSGELLGEGKARRFYLGVLCIHRDVDGIMIRVSIRPGLQLAQTTGKRRAVAAEVEVLYMKDLEAGLAHFARGIIGRRM